MRLRDPYLLGDPSLFFFIKIKKTKTAFIMSERMFRFCGLSNGLLSSFFIYKDSEGYKKKIKKSAPPPT